MKLLLALNARLFVLYRLLVLFLAPILASQARNVGQFFHLTDVHLDANYSEFGDLERWCHAYQGGKRGPNIGRFGNHNFGNLRIYCDSPWDLVRAAFAGMHAVLPDPDYIFWTGDNLPHVPDSMYTTQDVTETMQNLTDLLSNTFPGVQVYPVLGNHDYWEASQFPGHSSRVYREAARMWSDYIGYSATMGEGGFYRSEVRPGLTLLGLNTNMYYYKNRLKLDADPGGQLAWLRSELELATREDRRVIIIGHIPPGSYERAVNVSWFLPEYNEAFMAILQDHAAPILHMFFGHNHIDSFRLVYDDQGRPMRSILIAPSVCPGRSNNPSFRVLDYDRDTWEILDIRQYYVDLTTANEKGAVQWDLEYSFREAYGLEGALSAEWLGALLDSLAVSDTLLQSFYQHNTAMLHRERCEGDCRRRLLCTLRHLHYPEYWGCLGRAEEREDGDVLGAALVGLLCLAAAAFLLSKRSLS